MSGVEARSAGFMPRRAAPGPAGPLEASRWLPAPPVTGGPPAGGSSAYGSPPPGLGAAGLAGRLAGPVEPPSHAALAGREGRRCRALARVRRAPVHAHGLWGGSPRSPPAPSAAGDLCGRSSRTRAATSASQGASAVVQTLLSELALSAAGALPRAGHLEDLPRALDARRGPGCEPHAAREMQRETGSIAAGPHRGGPGSARAHRARVRPAALQEKCKIAAVTTTCTAINFAMALHELRRTS